MSTADITRLNEPANEQAITLTDASSASNQIQLSQLQPRSSTVILISLAILVAVLALGFFAAGFYESLWHRETQSKATPIADSELAKLRGEQIGRLNEYRWVDQAEQRIAIPIERAMQLTVERLKPTTATANDSEPGKPESAGAGQQPDNRESP